MTETINFHIFDECIRPLVMTRDISWGFSFDICGISLLGEMAI